MAEETALLGKKNIQTPTRKMPKAFFVSDPVNSQQSTVNSQQSTVNSQQSTVNSISPHTKSCQ